MNIKKHCGVGFEETSDTFAHKLSEKHVRVAVIGNVDAGKSTLIGTLKGGQLDDGRGQARANIMKHRHEIESGRTSTISSHLIGYDEDSNPIMGKRLKMDKVSGKVKYLTRKNDAELAAEAHNLITLVDLAGHEKYLKSTLHGISSGMIDYALVLVNSKQPPTHMTIHHIHLAITFNIPIIVVLTKVDGCPKHVLMNTKQELNQILRSANVQKKPFQIKQVSDVAIIQDNLHVFCPIVPISCVTGEGLDMLHHLLASLPKRRRHRNKIGRPLEFLVEDIFHKSQAGGGSIIISGFVNAGRVSVGQKVLVGPFRDGSFKTVLVRSIHIEQTNVQTAIAGNSACLALTLGKDDRDLLRAGMYVLPHNMETSVPVPSENFQAEMAIVRGSGVDGTTITHNYETMVHVLHIKQCARVEHVELLDGNTNRSFFQDGEESFAGIARPGDRALITFRFKQQKEYLRPGMRVAFRDGHLRGCGVITKVD